MKSLTIYWSRVFRSLAGILLLFSCLNLSAQQDPVFNQYMNNLLTIQPAYAGMSGYVNMTALSRIQWVGFDGAPNTNTFTIQGPFKKYNVGLGLSIISDRFGPVRQTGVYADYSYRVLLENDTYFSFGMKGGFNRYEALMTDLVVHDPSDPVAAFDINKKYLPNFGIGFIWHADQFFLGASVPKIFKNKINSDSGATIYQEEMNFYAMGGYVLDVNDFIKFKPTVLARWSENTPTIIDFSANGLFYDRVWLGATYRMKNSYGLLFQIYVTNSIKLGYAYDLTSFRPSQYNAGTHEFMLSYDFPVVRKRFCRFTPRYF
ncbi:MAG: type IX secretion system membrane protein PorP/SprF [Marinilabiliales bacterium]|nr:type IX secretion system membrane protein PorP/SprF [Marinilabiliales bacterium]